MGYSPKPVWQYQLRLGEEENLANKRWFFYQHHVEERKGLSELLTLAGIDPTEKNIQDMFDWALAQNLPIIDGETKIVRLAYTEPRTSRTGMYMEMAKLAAGRSTCLSAQIGCIITVKNRLVSQGYNGAPNGTPHCTELGVCRKQLLGYDRKDTHSVPGQMGAAYEASRAVHAEASAICAAARLGIAIEGGTFYVTRRPCTGCIRMILNCEPKQLFFLNEDDEIEEFSLPDPQKSSLSQVAVF